MRAAKPSRRGLTLIEVMISMSILGVVLVGFTHTVQSAQSQHRFARREAEIERAGERAMNRMLDALRYADWSAFSPLPTVPFSSPWIEFQVVEDDVDAVPVLANVCRIQYDAANGRVVWVQDFGLASEQSVGWTQRVAPLQEGESLDGTDENGNGLIDEAGLCFCFEDSTLVVRLTLTAPTEGGGVITRSFEARLDPRNEPL